MPLLAVYGFPGVLYQGFPVSFLPGALVREKRPAGFPGALVF
ncbi:hypothetical protein [Marinobacter phage PS6]|nr:hypothetical protein [Marinobacter phage PS6]